MTPQELKSSILQLAIQGKLVEQRSEEGTGEELYQQIQEEKQKLIKEGKIKKEKPLPIITEDEIPFDIPEKWTWIRLADVGRLKNGYSFKSTEYTSTGIQVVRISDLGEDSILSNDVAYYPLKDELSSYLIDNNCFLICMTGSIGKMAWVRDGILRYLNQRVGMFTPNPMCCCEYLWYFLHTAHVINGWIRAKTSTNGNIKTADIAELVVPFPPLAEQKRIVSKIEELLPLIDRYEKAWSRLEDFNKRFPVDMQKSILQMAIQGKLVEQRPKEGTGEELYQQIQAEKQKLIKAGKIKKEKPLPEISEDEIPFEIPESWKWACLLDVIEERPSNGYSPKGVDYVTEIRNLTLTATTSGRFNADAFKYVDIPQSNAEKYWLKNGDLLVQRSNSRELVGTSCIYTGADNAYIYPDLMMRMRVMNGIYVKYIDYVLKSPMVRSYYMVSASGISESMPKINQGTVSATPIPLPPLAEQKRIVAKLEEILPLCERLK